MALAISSLAKHNCAERIDDKSLGSHYNAFVTIVKVDVVVDDNHTRCCVS